MANLTLAPKKLSIYEIVSQLGLTIGHQPHLFSDCFNYEGMNKESIKKFKSCCGGISGVISRIIPEEIDEKYSHSYDLRMAIENNEKYARNPSIVKYQPLVTKSLCKIIGFLIVKNHKECEADDRLMKMREVILAAQNMTRVSAIGAHKGPNTEDVMDANIQYASSQNVEILSIGTMASIRKYFEYRMYELNDMDAFKILQLIYLEKKKLLPPSKDTESQN